MTESADANPRTSATVNVTGLSSKPHNFQVEHNPTNRGALPSPHASEVGQRYEESQRRPPDKCTEYADDDHVEERGAEPFPKTGTREVEGLGCRGGCAQWNGHRRRWQSCVNAAGHWRHAGFGHGDQRRARSESDAAAGRCWRG